VTKAIIDIAATEVVEPGTNFNANASPAFVCIDKVVVTEAAVDEPGDQVLTLEPIENVIVLGEPAFTDGSCSADAPTLYSDVL
jgi:hypothetical protein